MPPPATGRLPFPRATRLVAAALTTLAALLAAAPALGLTSPGFKPVRGLDKVTPKALPSITLGTGKYPALLVDGAGTAHIVYTQEGGSSAPDTLAFCALQRGIKHCAAGGAAPNPQAPDSSQGGPFLGNFPGGNHDFDGPAPLVIGNQLYVVQRRFPDVFPTPSGTTSESNVFEWSSSDGGQTLTAPSQIGDNQMAGGAIAYGDPNAASVATISRTETGGTFFQGTAPGVYATAKAQLGVGDQAYDGSLAPDLSNPALIRPVAAFADLSGNVFVREWSGQGNVNDPASWSETSFPGFSPQIVGGASGVFLLTSDSRINGGRLTLRRIVGGQPSGAPVSLGRSDSPPAISEDASGELSFAYTDRYGVEVRTSSDGVNFSTAQFTAVAPNGGSIAHLVTAATADGGGFVSFVKDPSGAEGVGQVVVAAFGTQVATGKPGLGPLPGGGIGSAAGDQMATSDCQSAKFGAVDAELSPKGGGCFSRDPKDPNMVVSFGTIDLNGLLLIPDQGTKIGIDPKAHKIQTTGPVRVILRALGLPDITLYHGPLAYDVPNDGPGDPLFDPYFNGANASKILGFPIEGDIDIKIARGGVEIPISLALPKYLGGVSGSAILHASSFSGLSISSLEFMIDDANLGFLELKKVDVKYMVDGNVWSGRGELKIPSSGAGLDATISVEFSDGKWSDGKLVVSQPYAGLPLDDTDPPPQLFLTQQGFELKFLPNPSVTGFASVGVIPLLPYPNPATSTSDRRNYTFYLDGQLGISFGSPVTITLGATGYLFGIQIADGKLVYGIPDQVSLNGNAKLDLGVLSFHGQMSAIIDPRHKIYGGSVDSTITVQGSVVHDAICEAISDPPLVPCVLPPIPDFDVPGPGLAINNKGFGVYIPFPGVFGFWGSITDEWGKLPGIHPFKNVTGDFKPAVPPAAGDRRGARSAAAMSFNVPAGAPTTNLIVHGTSGPPAVTLTAPGGQQITPAPIATAPGATAQEAADAGANATYIGIAHPQAGHWTVVQAGGSHIPISDVEYAIGEQPPKISATVKGSGRKRVLRYRAKIPAGVAITVAEQTGRLLHAIGTLHSGSGTIPFQPAFGPGGRRQLTAQIVDNGLPLRNQTLGSYIAPPPPRPGRAANLHVSAGRRAFSYSFRPPANANRILIKIVATDGRHLQRTVSAATHSGSVPVLVRRDGVTITVIGLGADGSRGPAVSARARLLPAKPRRPARR